MAKKEETYEPFGSDVSNEELAEEYAGLGKSVFVCRKENFERQPGQPYINEEGNLVTFVGQGENKMEWEHREQLMVEMWHEIPLVDSSYLFDSGISAVGQKKSKKTPRSFSCTFTLVDDKEAHYEAQMLAITVLPVFGKSMLSITMPHVPFEMRSDFTKLYRNPFNFFYKELADRLSYPIRKSKWFPSLVKSK